MPYQLAARKSFPSYLLRSTFALLCVVLLLGCAVAQDSATIPNVVKFSGTIPVSPAGPVGVIFALYAEQSGGAPLWQEVQNVTVDAGGHYTSLLGSTGAAGIPVGVFSSNEARWLGVQVQGQPEQARVLLVSVPYAMKAADAQTLGGLPPSAFLRADAATTSAPAANAYVNTAAVNAAVSNAVAAAISIQGTATPNTVPIFYDSNGDLENSVIAQSGSNIGIGTAAPVALLHLLGTNPTMRMENYGPFGSGDSPNFNFFSANGTAGAPMATASGDNLGQFAAAGFNGSVFPGSKVKISFLATENWGNVPPMGNGTAMSFQTTTNGTTARTSRMFIDNTGNVGIGSIFGVPANGGTSPLYPLTVNGIVQSSGGFMFPDGTTQTTGVPSCAASQIPKWIGTGWECYTSQAPGLLDLTTNSGLSGSSLSGNVLTLGVDTTVQRTLTGSCSSGSAISSISQTGAVSCQTVSGGGSITTPVNWTGIPNPPSTVQGVLNVTNTAAGIPNTEDGPPVFADIPAAVVGTATGTSGITGGVAGIATGPNGVGVVAYSTTSNSPTLVAWSAVTGYAPTGSKGDYPKALDAMLYNETGGSVIQAEANAGTAPAPCSGSNCQQLTGVQVNMDATQGVTVGYSANMNSQYSQGLNLYFQTPLATGSGSIQGGSMINANVNCSGSGPCTYFQVDGGANINTSGGLNIQQSGNFGGGGSFNGQLNANNGLSVNGNASFNGPLNASYLTVGGPGAVINGNLTVNGNLSKSSGTFKIDHPLDPANKFLYHSFVESPDMMNIYNGNIVTDKHGVATVELPSYFQALNQDFRYQLTVIGQFAQAIVVKEIADNRFTIKTNKPSVKVSWQVTGVRHDAYAEAHRVVVEEDKGKERGTYLHPELFQKDPVVAQK